ncbi:MAG: sulfotransferase [Pseudomonadota bacterium]|nr:sulfotransferase [Pseudomonadota bacterium]
MNPARAAFDRALTFLRAGDGVMAEQLCRGALADFPDEPNLMSLLGAALNRQGRGQEAEPLLRRALEDEPGYAKGEEELGRSLLLQGRFDEAIERLRKALELDSKLQSAQLTLVHALTESGRADQADEMMQAFLRSDPARQQISRAADHHRAGRLQEAEAIYRELLRRDPRNLEALRLLALIAMNAEQYGQAEQLLKRAVEIAPDFLAAWVDLSRAQLERQDLPAAQASIERAAELSPHSGNVRIHVANVQARSGLHDQAIETYRRAIELNPELPAGYLGIGNVLKTVGRQAEAIDAYRRATVLRPESSEAWWSLSNLKTFRFEDSEIEAMTRQLEAPALTDESRVQFSFALAKASEDRGDYARAFELYGGGNRTRRAMENYDPVQTEVINDRIMKVFDAEFLARCTGRGHPDRAPIFVVGLPRSGSTLIEQILASHSEVDATHELPEVGRLIQRMNRDRKDRVVYPEAVRDFNDEAWAAFGRSYIEQTRQYRRDAPRFIDKNPNNFANIGLLSLALPNARFINTRRHPLDTCLSCYKQLFARGQPFTYDLLELGEYYLQYVRMMKHWHSVLPGRVLDLQYESVVADQEAETRRLLEFCGLPWEDACLRYYETERAIRTASSEQVRRPIYTDSVGLWRNYQQELVELIEILQPVLPRGGGEAGIALSSD